MKTLFRFAIMCCLNVVALTVFSQNRYWVIPPNYIDFYTGDVQSLPNTAIVPATSVIFNDLIGGSTSTLSGAPLNKASDYTYSGYRTSNGIFNHDGELQFYLNNKMYVTMGRSVLYTSQYNDQLLTIPVPGKCDYYYLITGQAIGSGNTYVYYKEISLDGSSVVNKTLIIPVIAAGAIYGKARFALAPMTYNQLTSLPEMKLYMVVPGVSPSTLFEIKVKEDGLHYSQYFITDESNDETYCMEVEISMNRRWVAWSNPNSAYGVVYLYDLQSLNSYKYYFPGCAPIGIEFSPDNNGIFFMFRNDASSVCGSSLNKLGYFDLDVGTRTIMPQGYTRVQLSETDIKFMPNTNTLASSFIEFSVDGLMYISDGTNLKGFDPANIDNGFVNSYSVPNPLSQYISSSSDVYNYYSLNSQIDGVDHTKLFQIGCETSKTISNVTSANGSLEPISKVSQILQTANTVTITSNTSVTFKAGHQILLKPGFTVEAGGNFRGRLEACDDFVIDYCSGGARKASTDAVRTEEDLTFIHAFPNTITGLVNIRTGSEIDMQQIEVVSINGKSVVTRRFFNEHEATLDLSAMNDGVYILRIKHQNGFKNIKILLIR